MNTLEILQIPELVPAMARLEKLLAGAARADDPLLAQVAGHLIGAGGKRLRPALTLTAALATGGETTDDVLWGGVAVELVHLASLYHDDVMDEATSRRGVQSVNLRWDNNVAVVSGDFLLARAAGIAARLGSEVAILLADTLADLCEGQVVECQALFDVERHSDAYFAAVRGKTASLMATSCRIGAIVAGTPGPTMPAERSNIPAEHSTRPVDPRGTDALTRFGLNYGMAFQLVDDVLDIVGDDSELGKTTGQDLAEGVYTLPVLHALEDPSVGGELRALLGGRLDDSDRARARKLVASSEGISQALDVAGEFIANAMAEIEGFIRPEAAEALGRLSSALLDAVTTRVA